MLLGRPEASVGRVGRGVLLLVVNWFGDSLDGTLARVRSHERPRYGFYVDHVLDAVGILFVIGGLVLGGFMSLAIGAGFLIAYYLLTIEIALATHTVGTFRISYWKFGPTELRILLAVGTLQLLRSPDVTLFGTRLPALRHRWRGRDCGAHGDSHRVGNHQHADALSRRTAAALSTAQGDKRTSPDHCSATRLRACYRSSLQVTVSVGDALPARHEPRTRTTAILNYN